MEEKVMMFTMQQMYTEAAIESLAEALLDKKQFNAFQLRKLTIVQEKLKEMTDQVEYWKKKKMFE